MRDFFSRILLFLGMVCSCLMVCIADDSFNAPFVLESRDLVMTLDKVSGPQGEGLRLVTLQDKRSGTLFCQLPSRPLFSLALRVIDQPETEHVLLADAKWDTVSIKQDDTQLEIRWKGYQTIPGAEKLTVAMQISADPNRDGIEISQSAETHSDRISILSMRLGQMAIRNFGPETKLFYPLRSGWVVDDPCGKQFNIKRGYPGFDVSMPWFVLWYEKNSPQQTFRKRNNVGLYVGIHDCDGSRKEVACFAKPESPEESDPCPDTISVWAEIQAENMGQPGNHLAIGGKAVLRSIHNDWYDGAMIYRDWVRREAKWYPRDKMDENGRTDSPQWIKEHCLWAMYRVDPDEMIPAMRKMRDAFGVPAAVHWYYWHKNPYDNDYPHFFPREGFGDAVTAMQEENDIFIMPYINGLLWDSHDCGLEDWRFTEEALPATVKGKDGQPALYAYGSKESDGSDVRLAHMCPTTMLWQNKVRENVLRLMNLYGTQAVYVDQIGAAIPELCFDSTHNHPLGGGHWWGDGYRAMLRRIRNDLQSESPDFPLCDAVRDRLKRDPDALSQRAITTECTGETSLDIVDGFLTWHHQIEDQVPAFAAVYGGAVQMIGRDYRAGKTYAERTEPRMTQTNAPLACRMKSAEALCFGEQIGWFVPTIVDEPDKFPFQRKIVRLRYRFRDYFYMGEMCRPPEFAQDLPTVTADWNYYDSPLITAPAVRGGCWRIPGREGKTNAAVILFANSSDQPVSTSIYIDLKDLGFDSDDKIRLTYNDSEGNEQELMLDVFDQPVLFPPETVFAWELRHVAE